MLVGGTETSPTGSQDSPFEERSAMKIIEATR